MNELKLVPVEPTRAMIDAAVAVEEHRSVQMYKAMLAAAPAVQGGPVAWSGWGCQYPGKMPRLYGDRRIAELNCDWENGDQVLYFTAAPQPAEQQPALTKYQPCGCVICTCEHEAQCQGCGAKHCGTHPVGQIPGPVYQQPEPDVAGLVEALGLALEYWRHRQQRYKNRKPRWVADAESALAAQVEGG